MAKTTDRTPQAAAFITTLHDAGWRSMNSWEDGGHVFELLCRNGKTVIVQIYPGSHGFEVWRPVSASATIAETAVAVEEYGR